MNQGGNLKIFDAGDFQKAYEIVPGILLGSGYDSKVLLVRDKRQPAQQHALKCSNYKDYQHLYNFHNEIMILNAIGQHEHIISLVGCSKDYSCILLEYMPNGNLSHFIEHEGLDPAYAKTITYQLATALKHLHDRKIVHGDLKPENVLVSQHFTIKLCDFGFAQYLKQPDTKLRGGSEGFTAPETRTAVSYDAKKCDVFALGVVSFILVFGYRPFLSNAPSKQDQYWLLIEARQWERFWSIFSVQKDLGEYREFFQYLVDPDPEKRPTLDQVLSHQWLQKDRRAVEPYLKSIKQKQKP